MIEAEPKESRSYDAYLAFERASPTKHEFAGGEIFSMAGGSRAHNRLAMRFGALLETALRDRPCLVFGSDQRVRTADDIAAYPDVSALCERPEFSDANEDELRNPALIVEVLSPSTEACDRGDKFAHYRTLASLSEYVLASATAPQLEVYTRESDGWKLASTAPGRA
jgi:Uma2 family endonuclease